MRALAKIEVICKFGKLDPQAIPSSRKMTGKVCFPDVTIVAHATAFNIVVCENRSVIYFLFLYATYILYKQKVRALPNTMFFGCVSQKHKIQIDFRLIEKGTRKQIHTNQQKTRRLLANFFSVLLVSTQYIWMRYQEEQKLTCKKACILIEPIRISLPIISIYVYVCMPRPMAVMHTLEINLQGGSIDMVDKNMQIHNTILPSPMNIYIILHIRACTHR